MAQKKITTSSTDRATDYAKRVLSGEYVAGPHVRNACRRHFDDLENGEQRGIYYDEKEAIKACKFFETVLFLSEGQFEGIPFKLHPSQAFIICSIYGWKRKATGFRRFRRAYIEQGKGNGKSPLAGGIGLKGLVADGEFGAEIYAAGATKEQAGILFRDAVKMRNHSPELTKRLTTSGGPGREYNLAHLDKGSFFRPISRETKRTGSGPRPHYALCDEVHEHPDRGVIEMLERGFKFRQQPLLLMITNSGTDRNSIAWEEHEHAIKVAAGSFEPLGEDNAYVGEVVDDTTFSYVCALDKGDDPLTQPECWVKANPLLGITILEDYLEGVVAQARAMPGKLNTILRLHFCCWTDASVAWMTRELLEPCLAEFDPAIHHGKKVAIGIDLSQVRDLSAMACVVETGQIDVPVIKNGKAEIVKKPTFDAWIEAWTPRDTMAAREVDDKLPYTSWAQQGFLHAPNGSSISFLHIAQTLAEYDQDYDILMVAYDRFAFRRLEEAVEQLGLKLEFVEHPQGGLKKGKVTEAMKAAAEAQRKEPEGLWMPGSLRILEEAMFEGRIRLRRNPVLVNAMMSAVTDEDKWDNRWLAKQRSVNKIDAAVALCMAVGAAATQMKATKEFQLLVF